MNSNYIINYRKQNVKPIDLSYERTKKFNSELNEHFFFDLVDFVRDNSDKKGIDKFLSNYQKLNYDWIESFVDINWNWAKNTRQTKFFN